MHFGISEGKGGVKTWKPSVVGYGYFLELPIKTIYVLRLRNKIHLEDNALEMN